MVPNSASAAEHAAAVRKPGCYSVPRVPTWTGDEWLYRQLRCRAAFPLVRIIHTASRPLRHD
jgi:hypothetical protein